MNHKRRSQKKKCLRRFVYFNYFGYCVFVRNTGTKASKLFQKRIDADLFDWVGFTFKEPKLDPNTAIVVCKDSEFDFGK